MLDLEALARLADFAEGQQGHVTEAQAGSVGVDRKTLAALLASGIVEPVIDGVVRLRAGGRHAFPRLYAAWLLLEADKPGWLRTPPSGGVLSHTSAVRLYRVGDLPGPGPEFTVTPGSPIAAGAGVHRAELTDADWQMLHDLPVTTPARTVADLVAAGGLDIVDLTRLVAGLLAAGYATEVQVAAALDTVVPGQGRQVLDGLLADVAS